MKERKTVVRLMLVIAVLLAANLLVVASGPAKADTGRGREPFVVRHLARNSIGYLRVWSDGQIDNLFCPISTTKALHTCDQGCHFDNIIVHYRPVKHPFEVVDANSTAGAVVVEYADGRVDFAPLSGGMRCTIAGEGSDVFCLGDVDRNGVTDATDLLTLLADWGECVQK